VTIKTYPQPAVVTRFNYDFTPPSDPTQLAAFLATFQDFAATQAPPELGIRIVVVGFGGFIVQYHVHGVYYGSKDAFEKVYAPLAAVAPPALPSSSAVELSYIDGVRSLDESGQLNSTSVPLAVSIATSCIDMTNADINTSAQINIRRVSSFPPPNHFPSPRGTASPITVIPCPRSLDQAGLSR